MVKKIFLAMFYGLTLSSFILSCAPESPPETNGDGKNNGGDQGTGGNPPGPQIPGNPPSNQGDYDPIKLSGIWGSSCQNSDDDRSVIFYFVFDVRKETWMQAMRSFGKVACKLPLYTLWSIGTLALGDEVDDQLYRELDVFLESRALEFHHPDIVLDANKNDYYQYDDWELDVPKEIMGRKDTDGNEVKPSENFNVVEVRGDELYLSPFSNSKDKRNTELVKDPYRRIDSEGLVDFNGGFTQE